MCELGTRAVPVLRAPGPSTPDTASRKVRRSQGPTRWLGLVVGFESCERAHAPRQPRPVRRNISGAVTARLRLWGRDSNQQQALVSVSERSARSAPGIARLRNAWLTDSTEELLWARIRGRRLGVLFRRQVPVLRRFIADFLAAAQRLVTEVDGAYHGQRGAADARRDAALITRICRKRDSGGLFVQFLSRRELGPQSNPSMPVGRLLP